MRKIKDIISKPSEALQAMVDGLLEQDARPDFNITMSTFGCKVGNRCFGCAATCAIQKITGVNFDAFDINKRYVRTGIFIDDLKEFEAAIDWARHGKLPCLFNYFDLDRIRLNIHDKITYVNFNLENHNWRQELPKVTAHIKLLQEAGY